MSGFQVGVTALAGPAQRFKQIATDLGMAGSGATTAAGNGSAAAGTAAVSSAADVFKAGVQGVLTALSDDAGLLGDKVQKAGITYEAVDKTAMPSGTDGGPSPPGQDQPAPVPVAAGDTLWALAAKQLGPGASNADVSAEVRRWYEANRDEIGPNPDRLAPGTKLRVPG
jgi:resuscitation-promoting factor RpfA